MRSASRIGLVFLSIAISGVSVSTAALDPKTRRASVRSNGSEQEGGSYLWKRSVSADGKILAFETTAPLVGADENGDYDIYVHNMKTGKTERVSVRSNGAEAEGGVSLAAEISANGRFVVFESGATNLVPNDTNGANDAFIHDRRTDQTRRVSLRSNGNQAEGGASDEVSISPNGRFVAFQSAATNLVANDDNLFNDIFVRNLVTGRTRRASVRSNGTESDGNSERPSVADDGSVAFSSTADNLVANDDNLSTDVFVHRWSGNTRRVSVASNGDEGDSGGNEASISRDGDVVAFVSGSSNFVSGAGGDQDDIFIHRLVPGKTKLVSKRSNGELAEGSSGIFQGALSYSGRYVAFTSEAENLVSGDDNGVADMFWHDMKTGKTKLVSVPRGVADLNGDVNEGSASGDGRFVAFDSEATNLVANDENESDDVFRRGPMH